MTTILRRSLFLLTLLAGLVSLAPAQTSATLGDMSLDVRNGDQQGKLMIRDTELSFESMTDAKHSRAWKYADIRSLEKKRKEVRVRPFKGARYDFQLADNKMRDTLYDMITKRILIARAQGKK